MDKLSADFALPPLSKVLAHVSPEAAKRLVVLTGLKNGFSREEVEKLVGCTKRIRQLHFPLSSEDNNSSLCAAILYRGKRDAAKAVTRLNSLDCRGSLLNARLFEAKPRQLSSVKRGRLIIRNLSFKCDASSLKDKFCRFGEVTEVVIPVQSSGKKRGFGIVQFKSATHAAEAIKQMNGTTLLDRPIAVDWMVAKNRYMKAFETEAEIEEPNFHTDNSESNKTKTVSEDDHMSESNDEDGEAESSNGSAIGDNESDDVNDSDEDDGSEQETSIVETKKKRCKQEIRKPDIDEGKTVFIRNLSFDTGDEDLEVYMSKFGEVAYCCLVVDPVTEHPKGTAFVKFKSKEGADECLKAADDYNNTTGGLTLDGRKLIVSLAVSRDKIQEITSDKKVKKIDSRNLHLIRESLIRPGTKAAEGLSKTDISKRLKVEAIMRQKLRNPNIFVSTTRLCVRNIPTSVDDGTLKKIFVKSANNPQAKVTECRIMRDFGLSGSSKTGKSRGYGFINFTSHADALRALRNTNNNPDIFGERKRLIVEFSLENRSALLAKEKRAERAVVKKTMFNSSKPERRSSKKKLKVETVPGMQLNKDKSALPSHTGPKIRHKSRTSVSRPTRGKPETVKEPKKKKRKTDRRRNKKNLEVRDEVDQLVAKYRQKISANGFRKWVF